MTYLKLKDNYVANCIRKHMRINVKKQDKFYYKLAKIAKECVAYNYIYGIDMVWDFKKNCWITSKNNTLDMFNTACQIGANLINMNIQTLKKAIDIVFELGENNESQQFCMPSTSRTIVALKKEF
jgi:hypothetical protein